MSPFLGYSYSTTPKISSLTGGVLLGWLSSYTVNPFLDYSLRITTPKTLAKPGPYTGSAAHAWSRWRALTPSPPSPLIKPPDRPPMSPFLDYSYSTTPKISSLTGGGTALTSYTGGVLLGWISSYTVYSSMSIWFPVYSLSSLGSS